MNYRLLLILLAAGLLPAAVAQDDEVPPTVEVIDWDVFRPTTGDIISLDPVTGQSFQHEELDIVQIRLRITDFNWTQALEELNGEDVGEDEDIPEPPDYEGVFMQVTLFGNILPPPAAPIIPEVTVIWPADLVDVNPDDPLVFFREEQVEQFFGSNDSDGFIPTQNFTFMSSPPPFTEIVIAFQIPEFLGERRERLANDGIGFDIDYIAEFEVSNESNPSEEDEGLVSRTAVTVGAIQSPELAEGNPQAVPDAAASATLVESGTLVTLDGSRTFDSSNTGLDPTDEQNFDADDLNFVWEWLSGPVKVDPFQESSSDPKATVVLTTVTPADGSNPYVFRLLVDDGQNAVPNAATVSIEVVAQLPENLPPTVSIIGPAAPVLVGETITLDGSGSADPDGDDLRFRWTQTNALGEELAQAEVRDTFQPVSGLTGSVAQWQALTPGRYYFRLLVSDGNFTTSTRFTLDVIASSVAGAQFVAADLPATVRGLVGGNADASAETGATADGQISAAPACGFGMLFGLTFSTLGLGAMRRRR